MSKEERLQLENELLMTCSKAQAINRYIDEVEENRQLKDKNKEQSLLLIEYQQMEYERDLYKEVIEEVRTAINYMIGNVDISEIHGTKLLQILDKVGD